MGTALRGLYAITPDEADTRALAAKVAAALAGGIAALQYRNKTADGTLRRAQAAALAPLCRERGVPFIVNDDLELAIASGADGLHLGGTDGDLANARRRLAPGKLLGASCYDRYDLALAAKAAGADYVAFGAAFSSPTKPNAVRATLELYARAHRELGIPIVAIGGITADNAAALVSAGVDAVAVITDLFEARDIAARARDFNALFETTTP
ncbi:MAG: thiamine phosphate synthase [Burkholderiales bacterium]|jgi:thiamine-phosphate pyrophosphorylase|nr:thiamine phosphate synthase [Burkholderiales bacterium]